MRRLVLWGVLAGFLVVPARHASAAVILNPLDPVYVDTSLASISDTTQAAIQFVNLTAVSVDIYWINYSGDRVLYVSALAAGTSVSQGTYLTHPWLVLASGTGGTTAQGTGTLIAGFLPETSNPGWSAAADIARIPEPGTLALLAIGLAGVCRPRRKAVA
jgi:hypothetical protein